MSASSNIRHSQVNLTIRSWILFCILISILFNASSFSHARIVSNQDEVIPVIIDSDGAADDVYGILYLLRHPHVSVKALTLSSGVSYVKEGTNNYLKLLDYLGYNDIPVAAGKESSIYVNHTFPTLWREPSKNFYGVDLPETELMPSDLNASELIVSIVKKSVKPITIVALGPLTNIALAIRSDPSISENIALIDIMGGAVHVSGNVGYESDIPNYEAEWNFYIDPHAAEIVFDSQIEILLVPLDATNQVPITEEFKTKLGTDIHTVEAGLVHQWLSPGIYFWDVLTAVSLVVREVITIELYHIDIVVETENHEGETIISSELTSNAKVAIDADRTLFEKEFLEIINPVITNPENTTSSTVDSSNTEVSQSKNSTTPLLINWLIILAVCRVCMKFSSKLRN